MQIVLFHENTCFVHRSSNMPDVVTANLIKSNIIVDSILLGNVGPRNTLQLQPWAPDTLCILRGISNVTGKVQRHLVTVIFLLPLVV